MVILLVYSLRKRIRILGNTGSLSTWLNYHIFCGIMGPVFILFHTSFKLGGLVSISFWSMMAVALSGVLGRYIYNQIPRNRFGVELSKEELDAINSKLDRPVTALPLQQNQISQIMVTLTQFKRVRPVLIGWVVNLWHLRRKKPYVKQKLISLGLRGSALKQFKRQLFRKAKFELTLFHLADIQTVFHYWHVIHRPFAVIMYLIMFIHIGIAMAYAIHWGA